MTPEDRHIWFVVLSLAFVQILVAGSAVHSSNQDVLSDVACIGGVFGSLANLVILVVVGVMLLIFGIRSFRARATHPYLAPLLFLVISSGLSIVVGLQAGLRCTV